LKFTNINASRLKMIDEGAHPDAPNILSGRAVMATFLARARRKVHGRFLRDEDFNVAQGLIRMVGVGKIVRRENHQDQAD
jgi:hypothetical protein